MWSLELKDFNRPAVKLSTTSTVRTRKRNIPISIIFVKPVFGFNSSYVSVSGGNIQRQVYSFCLSKICLFSTHASKYGGRVIQTQDLNFVTHVKLSLG